MTHDDIPYRDRELAYNGDPVVSTWATDRRSILIPSVLCPACSGSMAWTVRRGVPSGGKGILYGPKATEPAVPDQVTMVCRCGYSHAGRPPESTETGCGASWIAPLAKVTPS